MKPAIDVGSLRKGRVSEFGVRFAVGGAITVLTGLVAHRYGPQIGGLFLAFPAILPASVTLVARHEGREQASDEARGAIAGAIGMVAFAAIVQLCAERTTPATVLGIASGVWLGGAVLLWATFFGFRR
ncbi:MAG TPA: DUF3147 family protein [Candidatus Binatia bacterium]|jgi:hypothetical protein|nr:DUF3147 family protein [Candidatus Binatia bacterium]